MHEGAGVFDVTRSVVNLMYILWVTEGLFEGNFDCLQSYALHADF